MSRKPTRYAIPVTILLLGMALRLAPWGQNRFLEDEALYAYWGQQIATGADAKLDREPVDKPPLHAYSLALGLIVFSPQKVPVTLATDAVDSSYVPGVEDTGPSASRGLGFESAVRLPSLLASLASIALVYALGKRLYGNAAVGALAALLLALSPYDILFASTAFTDPLMTSLVLAALLAASAGRLGVAGLMAGLAAATKQQGLLFLPLVVGLGLIYEPGRRKSGTGSGSGLPRPRFWWVLAAWRRPWIRFGLSIAVVAVSVAVWDLGREQRPGFLEQSFISYGGLGPAEPGALGQRLWAWLQLVGGFWASPWFSIILAGAVAAWLCVSFWREKRIRVSHLAEDPTAKAPSSSIGSLRFGKVDLLLLIFVIGYLLLHWLVGFQVWDRYLLGLVPLAALLGARSFVALGKAVRTPAWRKVYALGLAMIMLATLTGPVLRAAGSDLSLGGDHGAYDGIDNLAAYIQTNVPQGAVLYHYWLGHHYRFYLYDEPLRLHWYPDLDDLAHDATIYRREPRYIAFPSWRDAGPAVTALADAGITLESVYDTVRRDGSISFRLYRLQGP